ncbi:MAG: hypothetical protein U9N14_00270 [Pseudomonadota bacterium]|nr:hypothetical protein [Pseudomonadota bacterium]
MIQMQKQRMIAIAGTVIDLVHIRSVRDRRALIKVLHRETGAKPQALRKVVKALCAGPTGPDYEWAKRRRLWLEAALAYRMFEAACDCHPGCLPFEGTPFLNFLLNRARRAGRRLPERFATARDFCPAMPKTFTEALRHPESFDKDKKITFPRLRHVERRLHDDVIYLTQDGLLNPIRFEERDERVFYGYPATPEPVAEPAKQSDPVPAATAQAVLSRSTYRFINKRLCPNGIAGSNNLVALSPSF